MSAYTFRGEKGIELLEVSDATASGTGYRRIEARTTGWFDIDDAGVETKFGTGDGLPTATTAGEMYYYTGTVPAVVDSDYMFWDSANNRLRFTGVETYDAWIAGQSRQLVLNGYTSIHLYTSGSSRFLVTSAGIRPTATNTAMLGTSGNTWKHIYMGAGTTTEESIITAGAIEIGAHSMTTPNNGIIEYDGTNFRGYHGGWVNLDSSGGGDVSAGGSPANTYIAYFTDSTTITGEAAFSYNSTTNMLTVEGAILNVTNGYPITLSSSAPSAGSSHGNIWLTSTDLKANVNSTEYSLIGGLTNPMTTKGDIIIGNTSGAAIRLAGAGTSGWMLYYSTITNAPYWGAAPSGGGDVYLSGTPVNNQLAIWTNATTIEGDTGLTWDGSELDIDGSLALQTGTPSYGTGTGITFGAGNVEIFELADDTLNIISTNTSIGASGGLTGYTLSVGGTIASTDIYVTGGVEMTGGLSVSGSTIYMGAITEDTTATKVLVKTDSSHLIGWQTLSGLSNPMTTAGDIIYGGSSGTPTRLAGSGTDDWILYYDTGADVPYWGAPPSGTLPTATTDGEMYYYNGSSAAVIDDTYMFWDDTNNRLRFTGTQTYDAWIGGNARQLELNGYSSIKMYFSGTVRYNFAATYMRPANDNYVSLGTSSNVWKHFYLGPGISTVESFDSQGALTISSHSMTTPTNGTIEYDGTNFRGYHNGWVNLDTQ